MALWALSAVLGPGEPTRPLVLTASARSARSAPRWAPATTSRPAAAGRPRSAPRRGRSAHGPSRTKCRTAVPAPSKSRTMCSTSEIAAAAVTIFVHPDERRRAGEAVGDEPVAPLIVDHGGVGL